MFLNRDLIDVFVVLTRVVKEFMPPPSFLMKDLPVEVVDVQCQSPGGIVERTLCKMPPRDELRNLGTLSLYSRCQFCNMKETGRMGSLDRTGGLAEFRTQEGIGGMKVGESESIISSTPTKKF